MPRDLARRRLIATPTDTATGPWGFGSDEAQAVKVAEDLETGRLHTVLDYHEPAPLPVRLVHAEGGRATAKVRIFLDFAAVRLRRVGQLG